MAPNVSLLPNSSILPTRPELPSVSIPPGFVAAHEKFMTPLNMISAPAAAVGYTGAKIGDAVLNLGADVMGRTRPDPSGLANAMAPQFDASMRALGAPLRAVSAGAQGLADVAGWGHAPGSAAAAPAAAAPVAESAAITQTPNGVPAGHPSSHTPATPSGPLPGKELAAGEGWMKIGDKMYQIQGDKVTTGGRPATGGTVSTLPGGAAPALGRPAPAVAGFVPGAQPGLSSQVSGALDAAAARGDWKAIQDHYQALAGGTYMGRTREQEAPDLTTPAGRRAFAAQQKQLESTRAGKETDARVAEGRARTDVAMDANQRAQLDAQFKTEKQVALRKLSTNNYTPEEEAGLRMMAGLSDQYKITSEKGDPLNGIPSQTFLTDEKTGWTKNLTTGEVVYEGHGKDSGKKPAKAPYPDGTVLKKGGKEYVVKNGVPVPK
jgi:hypothetical protein